MDTRQMMLLEHFEQALKMVSVKENESESCDLNKCSHEEVSVDNHKKTCLQCGQILEDVYIANFTANMMKSRKRIVEGSIQHDIPSFIDQHIKDKTIEIYKKATENKVFRNISKKSILLASLHRASALAGNHISYSELLDMFLLKQHEANRGFTILCNTISKKSEYAIDYDQKQEEMVNINSKLKKLNLDTCEMFDLVYNLFKLMKKKSTVINTSHTNSVICGCIYFWLVYNNKCRALITDDEFARMIEISKTTLNKVYVATCNTVFRYIMKRFFVILLKNCIPRKIEGPVKFKSVLNKLKKQKVLYGPDEKVLIYDPLECESIRVHSLQYGTDLPIEDVDDATDWNGLLTKQYYNLTHVYMLHINLIENDREIFFDFVDYNKINETKGTDLLKEFLLHVFETDDFDSIGVEKDIPLEIIKSEKFALPR